LLFLLYSCSNIPTINEDTNNENNEMDKAFLAIDMTNAPLDVKGIKGILSRNEYDSIACNLSYNDTTNSVSVKVDDILIEKWNLRVNAFNKDFF